MNNQGYAAIPRVILHCPTLTAHAKLVYVVLSSFVGTDGKAWPSLERICSISGLSQSSVQRAIRQLRSHGFLTWTRERGANQRWGHTIYYLQHPVVTLTTG